MDEFLIINCPHCKELILINKKEINCAIFRHGVYKHNMEQINPHLNKDECIRLYNSGEIYGCGGPFQLIDDTPVICDYI